MSGWPVWLSSLSIRRLGKPHLTKGWSPLTLKRAQAQLDFLLEGLGDPERERSFRMNLTLCRHRALTQEEHDALPESWQENPAFDIAGGPVEILWERGIPNLPSCRPCAAPGRDYIAEGIWIPKDCGECESCVARASHSTGVCACRR